MYYLSNNVYKPWHDGNTHTNTHVYMCHYLLQNKILYAFNKSTSFNTLCTFDLISLYRMI